MAANEQELAKLIVRLIGDNTKYIQMLEETKQKTQQATKEVQSESTKMAQRGAAIAQEVATPQEKLNARLLELNVLLKKGAIDQETYARAVAKTKDELNGKNDIVGVLQGTMASYALRMLGFGAAMRLVSKVAKQVVSDALGVEQAMHKLQKATDEVSRSTGRLSSLMDTLSQERTARSTSFGPALRVSELNSELEKANSRLKTARESAKGTADEIDRLYKERNSGERADTLNRLSRWFHGDPVMDTLKSMEAADTSEVNAAMANVANLKKQIRDVQASMAIPVKGAGIATLLGFGLQVAPQMIEMKNKVDELVDSFDNERMSIKGINDELKLHEIRMLGAGEALTKFMADQLELKQTSEQLVEAQKEYEKVLKEGQQITEAARTPLMVFNDTIDDLAYYLNQGAISMETFELASSKANKILEDSAKKTKEARTELQKFEAAAIRSAEARTRVEQHLTRNELDQGRTANSAGLPPSAERAQEITILNRIANAVEKQARKPVTVITPSGTE